MKTLDGQNNLEKHRLHEGYLKKKLSPENIEKMSADEFKEMYKTLWASSMWDDVDWYISNRLIAPNSLDKIKQELTKLLYGSESISMRYDEFKENLKGFGHSSISEILHFVFPDKYCLWNEKPKTVLPFLKLNILPKRFFKYQITSGKEYLECTEALSAIRDELAKSGLENPDFIDLDVFLWHICEDVVPEAVEEKPKEKIEAVTVPKKAQITSHSKAEYYLLELGNLAGFNTYITAKDRSNKFKGKKLEDVALLREIPAFAGERDLNSAREIDVIWFDEKENPCYCFEVEHTMDILTSLNRLSQLEHFNAKLFVIAPKARKPKFEAEMSKFPFRKTKNKYAFISYNELGSLYEAAVSYFELRHKLFGEETLNQTYQHKHNKNQPRK